MKGNRQINPEGPLCSAWELADISIRLGELLELGRPAREEALDLMDWAASYAPTVRINTRFAKRLTDDEAAESMRARILYAAKLKEPASFPISMDEFVKVISSSHDRRRRDDWRKKLGERLFKRAFDRDPKDESEVRSYMEECGLGDSGGIGDRAAFWRMVEEFEPVIPALRKLANAAKSNP